MISVSLWSVIGDSGGDGFVERLCIAQRAGGVAGVQAMVDAAAFDHQDIAVRDSSTAA